MVIVFDVLLILALVGLLAVTIGLAMAALALKNGVIRNAKRLYERPIRAGRNLTASGRGVVQQESVRVQHIGASAGRAARAARAAAADVKIAVDSLKSSDVKILLDRVQDTLKLIGLASKLVNQVRNQRESPR